MEKQVSQVNPDWFLLLSTYLLYLTCYSDLRQHSKVEGFVKIETDQKYIFTVGFYWQIGNGGQAMAENTKEKRKLATDLSGCGNRIGQTGIRMARQTLETHPGLG